MGTKLQEQLTELRFHRTYEKMRGRDTARIDRELATIEMSMKRTPSTVR